MASIFTQIIKGEIPSHKVYEDEHAYAFLDIYPVQPGHVLVIPKEEIEFVWDMPDELYVPLMTSVKKIALHMREVLPQQFIHERIVGTDVPHAHIHLIPFDHSSELSRQPDASIEPDHDALAKMAAMIRFS